MFSIVIPAYNEEKRLPKALAEVHRFFPEAEVIVVDDGSSDGTVSVAERAGAKVVRLLENRGKGAAVRAGVLAAGGDAVVVMDADLSVPLEFVAEMLSMLDSADVVVGSRCHPEAVIVRRQPLARRVAGRVFSAAVRILTGLPYRDTQCGFKGFKRDAAKAIFVNLRSPGFAFDVEVLLLARALGLRVAELGVVWRDGEMSSVSFRKGVSAFVELGRLAVRLRRGRLLVDGGEAENAAPAAAEVSPAARIGL